MEKKRVDVNVRQGKLRGIIEENVYGGRFIAFRGIPYAKPPIGELRFKDPVPAESWSGVRDASKFGNIALQTHVFTNEIIGNEDCLYLNVYTTDIEPRVKRAVMVWVHGGGFCSGSGNHDFYGPDYLIEKNVVLVTLNYRLGVFGFLNLGNELAAGNQGLKDTSLALRWVRENISNFGGDPDNITMFGASAGAIIVNHLSLNPSTNGLFHKAILQSCSSISLRMFKEEPITEGLLLAKKLGKQTSYPIIAGEFLKTIDARKIFNVSRSMATEIEKRLQLLPFIPSWDRESPNPFFPEHPTIMARRGVKMPLLLGCDCYEQSFLESIIDDKFLQQVDSNFEEVASTTDWSILKQQSITKEDLRSLYFGDKPVSRENLKDFLNMICDMIVYRSIYEVANIQMQLGHPSTFMYKFSYNGAAPLFKTMLNITSPGTTHCEEVNYLFYSHISKSLRLQQPKRDTEDFRMIDCVTQMWTDFAKTGNPTSVVTDLIPTSWAPLKGGNEYNYMNIDRKLQMETVRKEDVRCNWESIKRKKSA